MPQVLFPYFFRNTHALKILLIFFLSLLKEESTQKMPYQCLIFQEDLLLTSIWKHQGEMKGYINSEMINNTEIFSGTSFDYGALSKWFDWLSYVTAWMFTLRLPVTGSCSMLLGSVKWFILFRSLPWLIYSTELSQKSSSCNSALYCIHSIKVFGETVSPRKYYYYIQILLDDFSVLAFEMSVAFVRGMFCTQDVFSCM